jgi:hypothetical protein
MKTVDKFTAKTELKITKLDGTRFELEWVGLQKKIDSDFPKRS